MTETTAVDTPVSNDPDSFTETSKVFLAGRTGNILDARYIAFDYNGKSRGGTNDVHLRLVVEVDGMEKQSVQHLKCGGGFDKIIPFKAGGDGAYLVQNPAFVPGKSGKRPTAMNGATEAAMFIKSVVTLGGRERVVGDIRKLAGTRWTFGTKPVPYEFTPRGEKVPKKGVKDYLVAGEFKGEVAVAAIAAAPKANGALKGAVATIVADIVKAQGKVSKAQLSGLIFASPKLASIEEKQAGSQLANDATFLGALEGIKFDGATLSI